MFLESRFSRGLWVELKSFYRFLTLFFMGVYNLINI